MAAISSSVTSCQMNILWLYRQKHKSFMRNYFFNGIRCGIGKKMKLLWANAVFYRHFAVMALPANLALRPVLACYRSLNTWPFLCRHIAPTCYAGCCSPLCFSSPITDRAINSFNIALYQWMGPEWFVVVK